MGLQIESDCQSVVGCVKGVLVSAYCVVVIGVILRIMYRIRWFTQKKWSFELIPLSSTICQSVMQLILNLFYMNTKVLISALYFQTFTFGIISTSCSQLCLRIKYPHKQRTAKKYTLVAFSIAQIVSIIIYVLTLIGVLDLDCNDWFSLPYLFPMVVMTCYTFASIAFGSTLINIMKHKLNIHEVRQSDSFDQDDITLSPHKPTSQPSGNSPTRHSTSPSHLSDPTGYLLFAEQKQHSSNDNHSSNSKNINSTGEDSCYNEQHGTVPKQQPVVIVSEDELEDCSEHGYIGQLKRQLRLIEILFMATVVLQIGMDVIKTYFLDSCIQCQGRDEFQAQNDYGQFFLIFYQIVQITPCLIAPYVFYYIPYKEDKSGGSILLANSILSLVLEDDEDDQDDDGSKSNNLNKLSFDSKALLQEDFDFSSQIDTTNQNKPNIKKQQIKKTNIRSSNNHNNLNTSDNHIENVGGGGNSKRNKRSVSPILVSEIQNRQRSTSSNSNIKQHTWQAQKRTSKKNQKSEFSKTNNVNSNIKSKNFNTKNEDSLFEGLKSRKLDDTMEDMGDFIDRMSMKKDDLRKSSSQAGSLILHLPFLNDHHNANDNITSGGNHTITNNENNSQNIKNSRNTSNKDSAADS